jgi:methylthioribulose-1-phosphate dehydratase
MSPEPMFREPDPPGRHPAQDDPAAGSIAELAGVAEQALRLSETMAALYRRGWCDGTGGNFSCTISLDPLQLLMAPSGVDKGSVSPEDLILVDADGHVRRGTGRASAETALHLAIVTSRRAGAVLHTHSQAATLLSRHHGPVDDQQVRYLKIEHLEMLKGLEGIHSHDQCIRLPILANDQDLGRLSQRAIPHLADAPYGLLLAGHGLYAWGSDLAQARRHLEILEFLLEQQWRQLLLNALLAAPPHPSRMGPGSES